MHNKKGMSSVVSNVLIILLVVVVVGVLGIFLFNFLGLTGDQIENSQKCSLLTITPKKCTIYSNGMAFVNVEFSNQYDENLTGIDFAFSDGLSSKGDKISRNLPELYGSQGYLFSEMGEAREVGVNAVFTIGGGNYSCPLKKISCDYVETSSNDKKCSFNLKIMNFIEGVEISVKYEDEVENNMICNKPECEFVADKGKPITFSTDPPEKLDYYNINYFNPTQGISVKPITTVISDCESTEKEINVLAYLR